METNMIITIGRQFGSGGRDWEKTRDALRHSLL